MSQNKTPQAVQHCHELLLWMIPQLDKFPRQRRFTLGARLEVGVIEVMELLIEASYTRQRQALLYKANHKLEIMRHLWRLSFELRLINVKRYEYGSKLMNEIGKQVGGWLRSQQVG